MVDPAVALLDLYDRALPQVYGYLLSRCGRPALAEDLTAETFLAAVDAVQRADAPAALVDEDVPSADRWELDLDAVRARQTLDRLGAHHRAALTLRYLDDLPVPEVAALLERTVHATEALLVRARAAFRRAYGEEGEDG